MSLRVGFVGLGNIGMPMAEKLLEASLDTTVFDLRDSAVRQLEARGAHAARSAGDLAGRSDIIGICVRDDDDVRATTLSSDGVLAGAKPGTVIAIHSTILPATVHEVARAAAERGVGVVDAPITGGAAGARNGTLCFMVGGEERWVERCRPAFESSAAKIVHTGELGSGAVTKLCNNLMTYLGFLSAFEANLLATTSGLSLDAFDEVTRANGNMSDQKLAFLALHRADTDRSNASFQETLRGLTTLAEKDLAITLAYAREQGIALPGTGLCQQLIARVYGLNDERRR